MVSDLDLYGTLATGSEKALLHLHLQLARDVLIYKVEGLEESERRRPATPTGTNLIGLVKHMTWIEGWYLCQAFGRPRPALPWEADDDAALFQWSDMYAKPTETTEELLDAYRAAASASDQVIDELDLDTLGFHPSGTPMSLRSLLLIVLIDTTRHAGQSDIVRELIDGATGSRNRPSPFAGDEDESYRERYLARVRGEVDDATWWAYLRSRP
jgi:hypothetical protein